MKSITCKKYSIQRSLSNFVVVTILMICLHLVYRNIELGVQEDISRNERSHTSNGSLGGVIPIITVVGYTEILKFVLHKSETNIC